MSVVAVKDDGAGNHFKLDNGFAIDFVYLISFPGPLYVLKS